MALTLAQERFWVDKSRFDTAERQYYETLGREALEKAVDFDADVGVDSVEPEQLIVEAAASTAKLSKAKKTKKANKSKVIAVANEAIVDLPSTEHVSTVPIAVDAATPIIAADVKPKKLKRKNKNKEKLCAAAAVDKENFAVASASTATSAFGFANNNGNNNSVDGISMPSPLHPSAALNARNNNCNNNNNKNVVGNANAKSKGTPANSQCTLVSEIAKAREHIKNSLEKMDGIANLAASPVSSDVLDRVQAVEKENADLRKLIDSLKGICLESQKRIRALEEQLCGGSAAASAAKKPAAAAADDDDGVDLFASDSDDENDEATRIREERLAAYAAKKSKKPALIAKSSLVLDIKPWDDETDLKVMEAEIRKIAADGLLWGASKFVPVAYGIQKLSISCVVEDDKISIDWLSEEIEKLEDYVQSVDVAAFNKI